MAKNKCPSKKEVQQLTHLGIVAFAARCARHVQPLYQPAMDLPTEVQHQHLNAIEQAITAAESIADDQNTDFESLADRASEAADAAAGEKEAAAAAYAVFAVHSAASDESEAAQFAVLGYQGDALAKPDPEVLWRDYRAIKKSSKKTAKTSSSPVDSLRNRASVAAQPLSVISPDDNTSQPQPRKTPLSQNASSTNSIQQQLNHEREQRLDLERRFALLEERIQQLEREASSGRSSSSAGGRRRGFWWNLIARKSA